MKKLSRSNLKNINGSGCPGGCPTGSYGPGFEHTCAEYQRLSSCCKGEVFVHISCVNIPVS